MRDLVLLTFLIFTYNQAKKIKLNIYVNTCGQLNAQAIFLSIRRFQSNYLYFVMFQRSHKVRNRISTKIDIYYFCIIIFSRMFRKMISLAAAVSFTPLLLDSNSNIADSKRHTICILYPNQSNTRGIVSFSQENITSPTQIACVIRGLTPNGKHGIHIHQFGDLTQGCATAGPHYNPHNTVHGGPFSEQRHVGDLGNLSADQQGNVNLCFADRVISLYGEYSIIGRSVVVHANQDDEGKTNHPESLKTGNSGPIACGVIGLAKEFKSVPSQKTQ